MSKQTREEPPPPPPEAKWQEELMRLLREIAAKSPDPLHEITNTIIQAVHGRPETVKAEYTLKKYAVIASFVLIAAILVVTTVLSILNKLTGDTAFILGTAFGSVMAFLYQYLSGKG
jgi:hypothetical protein